MASLAKCLSLCLQTKWLWVRVPLYSLKLDLSKEFLDIQATLDYRFTVKHVRDMVRTYS